VFQVIKKVIVHLAVNATTEREADEVEDQMSQFCGFIQCDGKCASKAEETQNRLV
jgi:hypothetical protein